jgi:hypothetical protein
MGSSCGGTDVDPLRPPDLVEHPSSLDPFGRLAALVEAYCLPRTDHQAFVDAIIEGKRVGGAFVRRRAEAGEQAFIEMWEDRGGEAGDERILNWLEANRQSFLNKLP